MSSLFNNLSGAFSAQGQQDSGSPQQQQQAVPMSGNGQGGNFQTPDALWSYLQKLINPQQADIKPTVENPIVKSVNGVS